MQLKCDLGAGLNCNYSLVNGYLVNCPGIGCEHRGDWTKQTEFRKGNHQDKEFGGMLVIFFWGEGEGRDAVSIESAVWRV